MFFHAGGSDPQNRLCWRARVSIWHIADHDDGRMALMWLFISSRSFILFQPDHCEGRIPLNWLWLNVLMKWKHYGDAVRRGMGVRNTIVRIREQDERMTHIKK